MGQNDLKGLAPERVGVLLVDFQNQFCHPRACGPGPVTNAANAVAARRAGAFAVDAARLGTQVIYTRQVLDPERLTARQRHWDDQFGLCHKGSWEAELFIDPVPGSVTVAKPRFDVWQSPEFLSYLRGDPVDGFIIAGVELRCCVLFAALGAEERGYRFVVPQDLVSGLDTGDSTYNAAARRLLTELYDAPDSAIELLDALKAKAGTLSPRRRLARRAAARCHRP
jgi:nicotinamidase-related amidase